MVSFEWLKGAGAAEAFMTGVGEGDCGWDGCESGSRAQGLRSTPIPAGKLVALRQCHGDRIVAVTAGDAGRGAGDRSSALADADGLITNVAGIPLGINVADCVPVLLYGPGGCGALHAGREGTAQNIAAKGVRALKTQFGVVPASVFAVIGPSAGPCCYQVSTELRDAWVAAGLHAEDDRLDLWQSNRQQLREAGLPDAHIHVSSWCTICKPGFYSYRGQQTKKRNIAVIMG